MLVRIGNVIWWAALIMAGPILAYSVFAFFYMPPNDAAFFSGASFAIATLILLIGRAGKYILSGV